MRKSKIFCCESCIYLFFLQKDCGIINSDKAKLTNLRLYVRALREYIWVNMFARWTMKSKVIDMLIVALLLWSVLNIPSYTETIRQVWKMAESPVVVLDPGHGGIDGGAVAADGTAEKDINLKIALNLKKLLEAEGVRVIMTRRTDDGLYEENDKAAIRSLKTQDMYERKRIIDEAEADLTISIHLNSFTEDDSVKGAQVFYPSEGESSIVEKSRMAAEIVQKDLNEKVNTDKKRTEMGKNDVFLLKEASGSIIIVECGFLSNREDLEMLKNASKQEEISKTLQASICKYLNETGNKTQ